MAEKIMEKIFKISITEPAVDKKISEGKTVYRFSRSLESDLDHRIYWERDEELIFQYLTDCWQQAEDEEEILEEGEQKAIIAEVITQAKELCVKYGKTYLGSCSLSLLPLIFPEVGDRGKKIPRGFLKDMFGDDEDFDNLTPIFERVYDELTSCKNSFDLWNLEDSLQTLLFLVNFPIGAKSLAGHKRWLPKHVVGYNWYVFRNYSILGSFFGISALPDQAFNRNNPIKDGPISESSIFKLLSSFSTIKTVMNRLYDGLAKVLFILCGRTDTRKNVLEYIAEVINFSVMDDPKDDKDDSRPRPDPGTLISFSAVMLCLCEPFLDADLTKRSKIDPKYVHYPNPLNLSGLAAHRISSSEEVSKWLDSKYPAKAGGINKYIGIQQSQEASSSGSKNADDEICEWFFLTARVLNLGLIKAFTEYENLLQGDSGCYEDDDEGDVDLKHKFYSDKMLCYEAQLLEDKSLIGNALSFYHLMIVWLLDLVGGAKMPLPPTCPMEFATLPQFFVVDAMEVLIFASRIPKALDGVMLKDFMDFIVMFMASPEFIKNPYLSEKMVKVLNCWMPSKSLSTTATLFERHQLYLVRNLLKLYVDNEFTCEDPEFEFKDFHHHIAQLLEYLWQVPSHRDAWSQIAEEEEEGVFLNFLNFLINDSIRRFDDSLLNIRELNKLEDWMLASVPDEVKGIEKNIRVNIELANEHVSMLAFASEHITAPFLLPEMVARVASMLNYFLLRLVSPQRNHLSLEDYERYESRPKNLLKQIARVYVHLARGDTNSVFPAAIAKDSQSYNDKLFFVAAEVLFKNRIDDGDERITREFIRLGAKAGVAASGAEAMYTGAILEEIPAEFLDKLTHTLMKDPVALPCSRMILDRSVIQGHLLSHNTDPYTRTPLTADKLIPQDELKAEIEKFVRSQHMKK